MSIAFSVNGVPIRLTDERWQHIVSGRPQMRGHYENCLYTVENPDFVLQGDRGTLIAIRGVSRKRYLAVVYRELSPDDGFIITAYFTSKIRRNKIIWQRN